MEIGGGTNAGTWNYAHTHGAGSYECAAHDHKWLNGTGDGSHDQTWDGSGNAVTLPTYTKSANTTNYRLLSYTIVTSESSANGVDDAWTNNASPGVNGTSASGLSDTIRPAAAVCTLQYPDLT